jgi:hypothetical protein
LFAESGLGLPALSISHLMDSVGRAPMIF